MVDTWSESDPAGKRLWLPIVFLAFGLLLTGLAVYQTQHQVAAERHATLDSHATRMKSELVLHIHRHLDVLRAYQAGYVAHAYFSDIAFQRMTEILPLGERVPGVVAVGYVPMPEAAQDNGFLVRYLHGPGLKPDTSFYVSDRDAVRMAAIHRARDTGRIAVSSPVTPAWDSDARSVNMVYLPLYRSGKAPEQLAARRTDFAGVMFVALRPAEILRFMMRRQVAPAVHARLIFEGHEQGSSVADTHTMMAREATQVVFDHGLERAGEPTVERRLPVSFAGTAWTLELSFLELRPTMSELWLPWTVLAMGALMSAMGALWVAALQRSRDLSLRKARMDRSLRREAEAALHLRERAIDASANAIVIASATEPGYPVVYVNPAFERMTGYPASEIMGKSLRIMHGDDTGQEGVTALRTLLCEQREGNCVLRNYRRNGETYWTQVFVAPVRSDAGEVTHFVAAKYDITQKRLDQEKLEFQAWHDALTQLPNRHALRSELARVTRSAEQGPPFWVAFMDLDNFKLINDAVGHNAGDMALQEIANRLQAALPPGDMVARRGGDEFVFILLNRTPPFDALATVKKIMAAISRPLNLGANRFFPSGSLGIAVHPQDGDDPETLIRHADMAMYHAKALGRNNYQFFSQELQEQALERVSLEQDLRVALTEEQFELHFQPQIDLRDGQVCGVEALVRWTHPEHGLMPPGRFIPLAEETGLIVPLGKWILRQACEHAAKWNRLGFGLRVAVNLSARQFNDEHLPTLINELLSEIGLPPELLELELTETMLVNDVESANRILHTLKGLGVTLSLDDFGTGYSSLAQLKRFPLDIIKIDRSFISDIHTEQSSEAITRTIIKLAHNLNMVAIAEGVETAGQRAFLEEHGCDVIQGYLISGPLPGEAFEEWVRQNGAASHTL